MNGNCYTYPLILLEVNFEDAENDGEVYSIATSLNYLDYEFIFDNEFAKNCETTTLPY